MTRLEQLVTRLEALPVPEQTAALRRAVIDAGGDYTPPPDGPAFTIALHGVSAMGYSERDTAAIWLMNARTAIGGFPIPDRAHDGTQIRWATHVIANPRTHLTATRAQAAQIILTLSANHALRQRAKPHLPTPATQS